MRAGTAVPLDEGGHLEVHTWPADESAHGTLYWDSGDGYGPWRYDRLTVVAGELARESEGDGPGPPTVRVRNRARFVEPPRG